MAWGKEAYTNREGNLIQPTIIDIDKEYGLKEGRGNYHKMSDAEYSKLRQDIESEKQERIDYILSVNPFYVANDYSHLIKIVDSKLEWDKEKVIDLCRDDVFRYTLYKLLEKRSENNLVD